MIAKFRNRIADPIFDGKVCQGKTRWSTEESAQWAITRLRRDYPEAFDSTVRPYRCSSRKKRGHWHLGHSQ